MAESSNSPPTAVVDNDKSEIDEETPMRAEIVAINRDGSLTGEEKNRKITQLFAKQRGSVEPDEKKRKVEKEPIPTVISRFCGPELPREMCDKVIFGCSHVKRDLYLLAPCCDRWYVCRWCHDENEDHPMDRNNIQTQCCMYCFQATPVGRNCTSEVCQGRKLADYYCDICHTHRKEKDLKFWHCEKCGICRAGAINSTYEHCDKCNFCYPSSVVEDGAIQRHQCLQSSSDTQDCPVCTVSIHSSQRPVVALRCGHGIHLECLQTLAAQRDFAGIRCPLCKRTFADMKSLWQQIDGIIATTVMPEPQANWTAKIGCNDCSRQSSDVKYHYNGLKCGVSECGSYNTFIIKLEKGLDDEESPAEVEQL